MPGALTTSGRREVLAQQTGEAFIQLLTLSAPTLEQELYVCDDRRDLVSNGITYQRFPFEFTLPEDNGDTPGTAAITICNVDRQIVDAVRSIGAGPLTVEYSLVMVSEPDDVQAGPYMFTVREVDFDEVAVTGQLRYEDLLNEPYPADTYSPARTPGIF